MCVCVCVCVCVTANCCGDPRLCRPKASTIVEGLTANCCPAARGTHARTRTHAHTTVDLRRCLLRHCIPGHVEGILCACSLWKPWIRTTFLSPCFHRNPPAFPFFFSFSSLLSFFFRKVSFLEIMGSPCGVLWFVFLIAHTRLPSCAEVQWETSIFISAVHLLSKVDGRSTSSPAVVSAFCHRKDSFRLRAYPFQNSSARRRHHHRTDCVFDGGGGCPIFLR